MDSTMVLPNDLECDVALKLSNRQCRMAFGIVLAPFLDVARGRSWQEVNPSAADQPFDVTAEMGRPRRAPIDLYPVVPACTFECMTMEIRAVVDMYRSRQPATGHNSWIPLSCNHGSCRILSAFSLQSFVARGLLDPCRGRDVPWGRPRFRSISELTVPPARNSLIIL